MKNYIKLLPCAMILSLAACAKSPESIAPAFVSSHTYTSLDCGQLALEATNLDQALNQVSGQQKKARRNDTLGVLLLGLPVSTFTGGNVSEQVASVKGHREAVRKELIAKKC